MKKITCSVDIYSTDGKCSSYDIKHRLNEIMEECKEALERVVLFQEKYIYVNWEDPGTIDITYKINISDDEES